MLDLVAFKKFVWLNSTFEDRELSNFEIKLKHFPHFLLMKVLLFFLSTKNQITRPLMRPNNEDMLTSKLFMSGFYDHRA